MNNHLFNKTKVIDEFITSIKINEISFDDLFEHYQNVGFLYEEKNNYLKPYITLIKNNWESYLKAGKKILRIVSFSDPQNQKMGTVSLWKTTNNGWVAQHLTSTGYSFGVFALMIKAQIDSIVSKYNSGQNWFQPTNKYASRIFGTIVSTIGNEYSDVSTFNYFSVNPSIIINPSNKIFLKKCTSRQNNNIYEFIAKMRGNVYAKAEEFNKNDIELLSLNDEYKQVGLNRKRFIWIACKSTMDKPIGAVIANRGPFGINFSFIENRCDLIVDNNIDQETQINVCNALLSKVKSVYFDSEIFSKFPLGFIPVMTDNKTAWILKQTGAKLIRKYNQSVWLQEGFDEWITHLEKVFQPVLLPILKDERKKVFKEREAIFSKKGCKINSVSIDILFSNYHSSGFIYPAKQERLAPYWNLIKSNWKKALQSKDQILYNVDVYDDEKCKLSSLTVWKHTNNSIFSQHLISTIKNPIFVRAIQLYAQAKAILENYHSAQNWFSPNNPYAKKVFETINNTLRKKNFYLDTHYYIKINPVGIIPGKYITVEECTNKKHNNIFEVVKSIRGEIYANAEELNLDDIELNLLNEQYKKVGLQRKRHLWLAYIPEHDIPVGAAIAYRGPLGINFSFLENRCDLIVADNIDDSKRFEICNSLLFYASNAYLESDYPLEYIPVTTDKKCADLLLKAGCQLIKIYNQSIWLNEGFDEWYEHVFNIYKKELK